MGGVRLRLYHHHDGARVAYRETGTGPAIVLLHSLGLSHRQWEPVVAPLSALLLLTIAFLGYYNWRLSGNAFLFPHVLNSRTYSTVGLFLWDHPKPPMEYHNQQFEDFYNGWEREDYQNTWPDVWNVTEEKLTRSGSTYFWWGALLLLPGLPFVFSERKMRVPLLGLLLVSAGFFASIWSFPHYAAPVTCVIFLLLVHAIRHLRMMCIGGRPIGAALSCAAVFLLAGEIGLRASSVSDGTAADLREYGLHILVFYT